MNVQSKSMNKIQPLDDDGVNWVLYMSHVVMLITSKTRLKKDLTGWEKCPLPFGTAKCSTVTVLDDGKAVASADQIEERLYKINNWEQHEASVKQILFSTISNQCLLNIQNLTTATLI